MRLGWREKSLFLRESGSVCRTRTLGLGGGMTRPKGPRGGGEGGANTEEVGLFKEPFMLGGKLECK